MSVRNRTVQYLSLENVASGGVFTDGDWVESKDQDPSGSVRLTQLADVGVGVFRDRSDRWLREDQAARLGCTFLEEGDILIARMPDPIGRACLVPPGLGRAITAVDVAVLRVRRPDLNPRYVMWMINSPQFHSAVVALESGTTRKRISRRNLSALAIPVPELAEQRHIVEILEDHLSRLDNAVEGLRRAAQRQRALTESAVVSELTGRPPADVPTSGHIEPAGVDDGALPMLALGWRWTRLGQIADVVGGVTKDAKKQSDPSYVEVPYLRVANVQRGRLDLSAVLTIRVKPETADELRLEPGDVLLNEGGDRDKLGRGWVWQGEVPGCIHQNHVFRARIRGNALDPYLLSWSANTIGGRWCERNGKQSVNLASISLSRIRQMPVPLPPATLQAEILNRIMRVADASARMMTEIGSLRARAAALRRALLRAAFEGQLTDSTSFADRIGELAGV